LLFEVGPTKDAELRRRVVQRLTQTPGEFGCKTSGKQTEKWTRLRRESVAKWPVDDEPDAEQLAADFTKQIEKLAKELSDVPNALRPILQQWEQSHLKKEP
jgi:hypothetical protein